MIFKFQDGTEFRLDILSNWFTDLDIKELEQIHGRLIFKGVIE